MESQKGLIIITDFIDYIDDLTFLPQVPGDHNAQRLLEEFKGNRRKLKEFKGIEALSLSSRPCIVIHCSEVEEDEVEDEVPWEDEPLVMALRCIV